MKPKYKCKICGCETTNDQSFRLSDGTVVEVHRCDTCENRLSREIDWESDNEHVYESRIICPYCDYEYEEYDSYGYINEGDCDVECECCGKTFSLQIHQTVEFSTHKRGEDMPDDWEADNETDI